MTPEPVASVSRSSDSWPCGRLKKRRKNGSCNSGFCSRTRPRTAMLTTPGVMRASIGASVGTAAAGGLGDRRGGQRLARRGRGGGRAHEQER